MYYCYSVTHIERLQEAEDYEPPPEVKAAVHKEAQALTPEEIDTLSADELAQLVLERAKQSVGWKQQDPNAQT